MRILILGGDGMLGHQLLKSYHGRHEVAITLRRDRGDYQSQLLDMAVQVYSGVDVRSTDRLAELFADFQPEAVINAVGIIKQRDEAKASIPSLEINSLLPHRLSILCKMAGARLVQMSTDCVFSGMKGNYTENDFPDADDLYGRSKYLGEVHDPHCITLRSSIIGLELSRNKSLVEWFLAQKGQIKGFTQAIYTGLTTAEMARVIEHLLLNKQELSGVWQVASHAINKYDLLTMLAGMLQRADIAIEMDDSFSCDRSLDGSRFEKVAGYQIESWEKMVEDLAKQIKQREEGKIA